MMAALLDVVPDELVLDPGGLLLNESCIMSRMVVNGKPLSAFAADNGFQWIG